MRLPRLVATAAVACLLTLMASPADAELPAAPAGDCTGVWVVVDATAAGGTVTTACATSFGTGTAALESAGFALVADAGFICQIDQQPATCTSSATGYWGYYHATPEGDGYGEWEYAMTGSDDYAPQAGDAEGWVFGDGSAPPAAPPAVLAGADEPDDPAATEEPGATDEPVVIAPAGPDAPRAPDDYTVPLVAAGVAGLAVAAVVAAVLLARRRRA